MNRFADIFEPSSCQYSDTRVTQAGVRLGHLIQYLEAMFVDVRGLAAVVASYFLWMRSSTKNEGKAATSLLMHHIRRVVGDDILSSANTYFSSPKQHLHLCMEISPILLTRGCCNCGKPRYIRSFCFSCGHVFDCVREAVARLWTHTRVPRVLGAAPNAVAALKLKVLIQTQGISAAERGNEEELYGNFFRASHLLLQELRRSTRFVPTTKSLL